MAAVACLVIAYNAASVLARSLPVLRAAGCDVFVHLDSKVRRDEYVRVLGTTGRDVTFLDDPVEVFWGGYSMMQAEFKLINAARATGNYNKYALISDDSFPILPGDAIAAKLAVSDDLVSYTRQPDSSPFAARYRKFFCYDHPATMARGHNTRSLEIDEEFEQKIAEIAVWRRIGKKPINVYHGSQFWCLTNSTIDLILDRIGTDIHLVKSFQYSALSDELMFQSILGNIATSDSHTGPVYADYACVPGPRVYTEISELPYDIDRRHLFIRKISPQASSLLEHMSRNLQNGNTIYGAPPDGCFFGREFTNEAGETVVTLRLRAPVVDKGSEWNGLENAGGRQFRWTARDAVTWELDDIEFCPSRVRFVITTVVGSAVGFAEKSRLTYGSQTEHVESHGSSLVADFAYHQHEPLRVTLTTPPPISPREARGHSDDRKLGFAIAT
jgi:Core-2/I-Branching enzyme